MDIPTLKKILLRLFNNYIKSHLPKVVVALILSFCVAGGTAAIAWLLDPAIKKIFVEEDPSMLLLIPAAIVFAFTAKGVSLFFARKILIKLGNEVVRVLQLELSSCFLKSDTHTIESRHSGRFIQHFLYDISLVSNLVASGVLNLMKDSLTLIVLIALMFYQNWKLAIFALIMMPLAAFVSKSLGKKLGKATEESAKVIGNLTAFLTEMIKGSRMIKVYQQEKFELNRSAEIMKEHMKRQNKIGLIMIRVTPIMEIITGFMIAGFIFYTGVMVSKGEIAINSFFSFLTAMMLAYQPIRSLATINMLFYQGAAGASRIFSVLDTEVNIKDNKNAKDLKIAKGNVELKNVSFSYPKTDSSAINNVNIFIEGGTTAALVGHSGAGKSTIINLLPRFYDPREGKVFIDGQNIAEISLSSLRKQISLVSQDTILFDDTVKANIAYANLNASENQIKQACEFAAASEFIEKLPQAYETIIGENGIKLSGGQKQRLSIARAILKDSPIILLDEATSSLDSDSEQKVQNAIINLTKNKTTLVIAHRLSTIIRANKIFVINQGKVIDVGSHKDLLENSTIYKNLYSKQLNTH